MPPIHSLAHSLAHSLISLPLRVALQSLTLKENKTNKQARETFHFFESTTFTSQA
jgi:hypothetical protein